MKIANARLFFRQSSMFFREFPYQIAGPIKSPAHPGETPIMSWGSHETGGKRQMRIPPESLRNLPAQDA
ncbi:MAG: hypothetical protein KAT39_00270 [Alphaproteobacteria bacterium]|nr:hypothetical protein [Alphaproteobacteria bacterium]